MRGPVIRPGAPRYAAAAQVYNRRFDGARPDAVIEVRDSRDVQAVLRWADRHDVRVAARSGGHSYAGYSTLDVGVVVDLRRLRSIAVDRGGRRASIGAGAHMIEVVDALARHGGAVPGGSCPTVGFGGLALGGGYGLASRALRADRRQRHRARRGHARRAAAPRRRAPRPRPVLGAARRGRRQLRDRHALRDARAPRRQRGALQRLVPVRGRGARGVGGVGAGDRPAADVGAPARDRQRDRARAVPRVGARLSGLLGPLRRAGATITTGSASYAALQVRWGNGRTTPRTRFSAKSHYVAQAAPGPRARRAARRAGARRGVAGLGTGSLLLDAYGGALNRPRARATAFVHRDERYSIQYLAYHDDAGAASRAWLRRMHAIVAPHASGAYQNYIDPDLRDWRRAYYGRNLARSSRSGPYDPDRRFRSPRAI